MVQTRAPGGFGGYCPINHNGVQEEIPEKGCGVATSNPESSSRATHQRQGDASIITSSLGGKKCWSSWCDVRFHRHHKSKNDFKIVYSLLVASDFKNVHTNPLNFNLGQVIQSSCNATARRSAMGTLACKKFSKCSRFQIQWRQFEGPGKANQARAIRV